MNTDIEVICKDVVLSFPVSRKYEKTAAVASSRDYANNKSFRALNGVSLTIKKGERIGLLGRNGAGKSTFLKMLAGVYLPESGRLRVNRPTTSLFEVSVGTDRAATGYENIKLLMASRGIPMSHYQHVVSDVETFTELGEALCRPMRTYSSGMKLRIAFAIATYSANPILLMDEVIGTGDKQFRINARERVKSIIDQIDTLVMASHNNNLLKKYCDRGLVFDAGQIIFDGPIKDAVKLL